MISGSHFLTNREGKIVDTLVRHSLRLVFPMFLLLLLGVASDASAQCQFCPGGPGSVAACEDVTQGEGNTGCYDAWNPEINHHCAYSGSACSRGGGGGYGGDPFDCPWWLFWINPYCGNPELQTSLTEPGFGVRRATGSVGGCSAPLTDNGRGALRDRSSAIG